MSSVQDGIILVQASRVVESAINPPSRSGTDTLNVSGRVNWVKLRAQI